MCVSYHPIRECERLTVPTRKCKRDTNLLCEWNCIRKDQIALDSFNDWSPQLLPVFGDVHGDFWVNEDLVAFEISGDIPFILGAVVFRGFVHIKF